MSYNAPTSAASNATNAASSAQHCWVGALCQCCVQSVRRAACMQKHRVMHGTERGVSLSGRLCCCACHVISYKSFVGHGSLQPARLCFVLSGVGSSMGTHSQRLLHALLSLRVTAGASAEHSCTCMHARRQCCLFVLISMLGQNSCIQGMFEVSNGRVVWFCVFGVSLGDSCLRLLLLMGCWLNCSVVSCRCNQHVLLRLDTDCFLKRLPLSRMALCTTIRTYMYSGVTKCGNVQEWCMHACTIW